MDLVAEGPGATSTASDRTIVLRSFGKTYGLAGLRLGFAILAPRRAAQLRRLLGPWPVSGPALAIGAAALRDEAWIATMRERLTADARRLGFLMRNAGTTQIGGTALFTLVAHPAASRLFAHLARGGILTRPFATSRPGCGSGCRGERRIGCGWKPR
jgi:Histidinol-phosphate/aromatic aminotransferase and cobyric acid decarboxylase